MGLPCFGVAFWSSLMARAACLGEMSRAVSIDKRVRSGARRVIISTQFRLSGSGGARGRATPRHGCRGVNRHVRGRSKRAGLAPVGILPAISAFFLTFCLAMLRTTHPAGM